MTVDTEYLHLQVFNYFRSRTSCYILEDEYSQGDFAHLADWLSDAEQECMGRKECAAVRRGGHGGERTSGVEDGITTGKRERRGTAIGGRGGVRVRAPTRRRVPGVFLLSRRLGRHSCL